ncbi:hypothetical protein HYH02_006189 [Chlamydomonas schloesseri]|uniref:COX assembly mitochondrial protein n=1 Tax=Chlamydomonas schloesseri TaxID=2026947 RepID=A0A836B6H4_9CHLO|nr:hypothetical protein HYH02_006189 [Chlamydomonas schloesseri]|eukprot:KAG2448838.1 hypothetical protein HYH02_006189 [Chlamydomonas schloesseri]
MAAAGDAHPVARPTPWWERILGSGDDKTYVSPHARNKIVLKLSKIGEAKCQPLIEAFNQCCRGKNFAQLMCKGKYNASQECMHRYMNDENAELVAKRWVELGRPHKPDWSVLLAGIEEEGDRKGAQAAAKASAAAKQ